MKNMIRSSVHRALALLSALAVMSVAPAQDAADLPDAATVLDRSVEVTGGRDAFERLRTFMAAGTVELVGAGLSGPISIFLEGDNYYSRIELLGAGTAESGVSDGIAWERTSVLGARVKTGAERSQALRDAATAISATANWRKLFTQVETVGSAKIDGEDAYEVIMTPVDGAPISMHFSVGSGLALRMDFVSVTQMGEIPMQVSLSNYTEFGELLVPTVRTSNLVGQTVRQTIDSLETNVEIPEGRFDLPEAVAALIE